MTIFEADWICPVASPAIRKGSLVVENGRIVDVGPGTGGEAVRFPGCAIAPGFVNAHAHLELTILRGLLENLPFVDWIRRLTRLKYRHLSQDELLVSARLGAVEMMAAGVTCAGEVMDLGVSWKAMKEAGMRGVAYQEVFGPAEGAAEQEFASLRRKIESYRKEETGTLRVGVSPHAPFTVSGKLFQIVSEYARREDLMLTIH